MNSLRMQKRNSWRKFFLGVGLVLVFASSAAAFPFRLGEVRGNLDTTLSYGLSWRMEDRDNDIIGPPKTDAYRLTRPDGYALSQNYDDGNKNYDKGDLISNLAKITSELQLEYGNFGLFLRGSAFYDFENYDGERERTKLSDEALELVGRDADLLDSYLWWNFNFGEAPGQVRVGDQVLSWGESTFIQNGINIINPFDVSKLRVPGSELKEGLVPVGMVSASVSPTLNLTFEGFYQYDWEEVQIDPVGFYWSTTDIAGDGADKVMLGFGRISDLGSSWSAGPTIDGAFAALQSLDPRVDSTEVRNVDPRFNMVPRGSDVYADNSGQYGLAMRVYAPGLNDTEFGFYYMNYHSRLPVISSKTGTSVGALRANIAGTAAGVFGATFDGSTNLDDALIAAETAAQNIPIAPGVTAEMALGSEEVANIAAGAVYAAIAGGERLVTDYATNEYAQTAEYFLEYPEDIQLFGISFNTVLPDSGVALQGEVSHRLDVPLQVDDLELLFATLGPINQGAAMFNQLTNVLDPTQFSSPYEQVLRGYERLDVSQVQMTGSKLFGPTFGADQLTVVGEFGVTYVHDMPDKEKLRFDAPGTPISGNEALASAHYGEVEPADAFADATSWGYRAVGKLDYNNALFGWDLSPRIAWSHDVNGTTPGPGGNFVDGRKAITFGIGANYLNKWSTDLSYTEYFGAGRYNLINDRDFLALNVKYSF